MYTVNIPIELPGNDGETPKKVIARVKPQNIQCHYPGYHFGCFIYLEGGAVLLSYLSAEEVDKIISDFKQAN